MRPRLGVVVSTWSHEEGQEYAATLPELLPAIAPHDKVELIACPQLLEYEKDIAGIAEFFRGEAIDALCLIPGNFSLDHVLPMMAESIGIPTILWGLPTREASGALVAVHQAVYPFKELSLPYRYVVGELGDTRAWTKVIRYGCAAALVRRLKGMRVGLMGWRAQGMSDTVFDELALRETFGVQVVNVGLTRYSRAVEAIPDRQVEDMWSRLKPSFDTADIEDEVGRFGVRTYQAMRQLAAEEALQAVTVECFHDHLGGPCLGCSMFNDEGIAASCESDVPGAILMAAGQLISGEPTFHVDINYADLAHNTAVLHHCGNLPRRLAARPERLRLLPIPEHIGAGAFGPTVQATMRTGPVTLANLVGRRGTMRLCAMEGEIIPYELEFPGSAAKVAFAFDLAEALEQMGNSGYGHHFAVITGHVAAELDEWCGLVKIGHLALGRHDSPSVAGSLGRGPGNLTGQ